MYQTVGLIGGGQPGSVFLSFYNLGPKTDATEACFQALTTYAVPRQGRRPPLLMHGMSWGLDGSVTLCNGTCLTVHA